MTRSPSHYKRPKTKVKSYADYLKESIEKGQTPKDDYIIEGNKVKKNIVGLSDFVKMPDNLKLDIKFKYSKD